MADVAATTVTVTPGGSFNFFGITITKVEFDAAKLKAEIPAGEGAGNLFTALPKGFVPTSVLPTVGATTSVRQKNTGGVITYELVFESVVTGFVGKIEVLVLGHY